jgi:GDP-L-fucose synthase
MERNSKIYIAGHTGLVGSALVRNLKKKGYTQFVFRTIDELDLMDAQQVEHFFKQERPEYVFLAAAKVGGIVANNIYRGQFIYENLQIQNNVIHFSYKYSVKKLLFLGSSCIYPKMAPQPMHEDALLTGTLEYTNEPYAIAKIAGMKMCESYNLQYGTNFISVMPTNLYGPNDNYDLEKSHVLPALIRKMHLGKCLEQDNWDAIKNDFDKRPVEGVDGKSDKEEILAMLRKYGITKNGETVDVTLWGTGSPFREFLHSDDMAGACIYIMENIDFSHPLLAGNKKEVVNCHINIGTGKDLTIKELAGIVKDTVNFGGNIVWDASKPDGTPKKQLDVSKLHGLGWKETIRLNDGIKGIYGNYMSNQN